MDMKRFGWYQEFLSASLSVVVASTARLSAYEACNFKEVKETFIGNEMNSVMDVEENSMFWSRGISIQSSKDVSVKDPKAVNCKNHIYQCWEDF